MAQLPDHISAYIGISEHFADYADAVDSGDFGRLQAMLDEATVVLLSGEELVGDRIGALYESVYAPVSPDERGRRRIKHHIANLRVGTPDADGTYPADVYYFVYVVGDTGPALKSSGRYHQQVQWRAGAWVTLRHEILGDL